MSVGTPRDAPLDWIILLLFIKNVLTSLYIIGHYFTLLSYIILFSFVGFHSLKQQETIPELLSLFKRKGYLVNNVVCADAWPSFMVQITFLYNYSNLFRFSGKEYQKWRAKKWIKPTGKYWGELSIYSLLNEKLHQKNENSVKFFQSSKHFQKTTTKETGHLF